MFTITSSLLEDFAPYLHCTSIEKLNMDVPSALVPMIEYCPDSSFEIAEMVRTPPVNEKLLMSPALMMMPERFRTYDVLAGLDTADRSRTRLSPDFINTTSDLSRNSGLTEEIV